MKSRRKTLVIAIFVSIIHCVLGNIIVVSNNTSSGVLEIIFLPYSFIAGASNLTGWDSLSIVLELVGFIFMTYIFWGIIRIIETIRDKKNRAR